MLAERQLQVERILALVRVFLIAACFFAIRVDATDPRDYSTLVDVMVMGYLLYALAVLLWLYVRPPRIRSALPLILQGLEILGPGCIALFSGGPSSPLFVFLVFALITAAYRWGLRETLSVAAIAILVVLSQAAVLTYGAEHVGNLPEGNYDLNRLLIRLAYLMVIGLLIGSLAEHGKRLQVESELMARTLADIRPHLGLRETIGRVGAILLSLFTARSVLVAIEDTHSKQVHLWEVRCFPENDTPSVHTVEADIFASQMFFFPLPGEIVDIRLRKSPDTQQNASCALTEQGKIIRHAPCALPQNASWRTAERVVIASFGIAEDWSARIFLLDPEIGRVPKEEICFFQKLLRGIAAAISSAQSSCRMNWLGTCQERMRIARELHDGAIQTLIATEMQIELLRRQSVGKSEPVAEELSSVQQQLRRDIIQLRELMQHTRPLDLGPRQFVEFLAELTQRFRRESGMRIELISDVQEVMLSSPILGQLGRIVQEALVNARKHSGARSVIVQLACAPDGWKLVIDDNGRGFDFEGRMSLEELEAAHKGPSIIKERVRNIGASLMVESTPGRGSRLEVCIPFSTVAA